MTYAMIGPVAGLVVGVALFATLEWLVRRWLASDGSRRFLWWPAVRVAVTIAGFRGIARLGAAPLVAGVGRFLVARTLQLAEAPR